MFIFFFFIRMYFKHLLKLNSTTCCSGNISVCEKCEQFSVGKILRRGMLIIGAVNNYAYELLVKLFIIEYTHYF